MNYQRVRTFDKLAKPFVRLVEKYYPDAFLFVIILSILTFVLAITLTNSSPNDTLKAWGGGLPKLFTFTAQITIVMITAHALAHTSPVEKLLVKLGDIPNNPVHAYALVTFVSGVASLFAWSFGLIVGGISAKFVAIGCEKKNLKIHYPLLVASAYSGYVIWHMGYSSSAALFVASDNHSLVSQIGIIPVTETIFNSFNITVALITLFTITIICPLMRPSKDTEIIKIDSKLLVEKKKRN